MSLETPFRIEPCLLDDHPAVLSDLISDVVALGTELGSKLHPATAASLADLVRVMNCYYSNLIEGHNTRPREIERALASDFDGDSSERVPEFMAYFAQRYRFELLGRASQLVAMAASHHRLNYIHPFIDGNGRVSRLMSHAMSLSAGIGAHGLWSISRGLARGLVEPSEYKSMMDMADSPRRGDLDGRGNLSREALITFVTWFLQVARDQLRFMRALFDLSDLSFRLRTYVQETLQGNDAAVTLVIETLRRGELARGDAGPVTGRPERTARAALGKLLESGLLASETPKGPVRVRFPVASVEVLFPRLFPAQAGLSA